MNRRQYEAARRLSRDLGATAEERDTARRRCEEYEAKQTQGAIVKWWRLRLCVKDGPRANKWLGNTTEFRAVLRYIKGTQAASSMNGCYRLDADSARAIDNGRVDWVHFPEYESANSRWRPPAEMRADAKRTRPLASARRDVLANRESPDPQIRGCRRRPWALAGTREWKRSP